MKYIELTVRLPYIEGVKKSEYRDYVQEACRNWCGQAWEDGDWWLRLARSYRHIKAYGLRGWPE